MPEPQYIHEQADGRDLYDRGFNLAFFGMRLRTALIEATAQPDPARAGAATVCVRLGLQVQNPSGPTQRLTFQCMARLKNSKDK